MTHGDPFDQPPTQSGQMNLNAPGVFPTASFGDQALCDAAADQGSCTVWTRLQTLGQFAYGGPVSAGKSPHVEQQQVLRGHDAGSA